MYTPFACCAYRALERVPYETLDIVLGKPPGIDLLASARRILGGRGGYCYHLNGAFSALLAWLGLDVTRHVAGVHGGRVQEPPGPDGNHLGLTVRMPDGVTWLVDVGLGDGPAEPLPLAGGEHDQRGFRYDFLGPSPFGDGVWRFGHEPGGAFVGFDALMDAAVMGDFVAMHAFPADRNELRDDRDRAAPPGRATGDPARLHYTERSSDRARSREVTKAAAWWELVLDHFGLAYGDLSADERSSLWRHVRRDHDAALRG